VVGGVEIPPFSARGFLLIKRTRHYCPFSFVFLALLTEHAVAFSKGSASLSGCSGGRMDTTKLIQVLTAPFAAGFVVQRFLEILDPVTVKFIQDPNTKRIVLGLVSLGIGLALAAGMDLRIFHQLLNSTDNAPLTNCLDYLATGVFVSGGTEGFNSLLKFANYKKESSKADAAAKLKNAGQDAIKAVNPQQ